MKIQQPPKLDSIKNVALNLGCYENDLTIYGDYAVKINKNFVHPNPSSYIVLVTAMTPTKAGIGKTTMSIALADGLRKLGHNAVLALREPSLGPVFGMKGGACGGGLCKIVPEDNINLHFTGDFHAISAANNLIAAAVHNLEYQHEDKDAVVVPTFRYVMDMNARDLRESFDITPASEVMACFCLAENWEDLTDRIASIVVGYYYKIDNPDYKYNITVKDMSMTGAVMALLKDAYSPNLVQTLYGTPAFVHGGPFANIAHGCSSVIATQMARTVGDIVVTEAGFGADMGAEKYMDIVCTQYPELVPDCVVLVVTTDGIAEVGIENVCVHVKNITDVYKRNVVVVVNMKPGDTEDDVRKIADIIYDVPVNSWVDVVPCYGYSKGPDGSVEFANAVAESWKAEIDADTFENIQGFDIMSKIISIANKIYHTSSVEFNPKALQKLRYYSTDVILETFSVCIAKTQYKPTFTEDFKLTVNDIVVNYGARLIIPICGNIIRMPGLPKMPNACKINVINNTIQGIS